MHLPDGTSSEAAVRHLLDLVSAFKKETAEAPTRDGRVHIECSGDTVWVGGDVVVVVDGEVGLR